MMNHSDIRPMRKTRKSKKEKNAPLNNIVAVGVGYLAWRFVPGSIPGMANLSPILCDLKV